MLRFLVALSSSITLLATFLGYQPSTSFFGHQPTRVALDPALSQNVAVAPNPVSAPIAMGTTDPSTQLIGADDFTRSAQNSWPDALKGGQYTLLGPSIDFAAGAGIGTIRTLPGQGRAATLLGVNARDVDLRVRIESDRPAEGGDQFVFLIIRRVDDATNYLARVRFDANHSAWLEAARTVRASTELLGGETRVPDYLHRQGSALWVRAAALGQAPTALRLKAWPDGQPEPPNWPYAVTDDETSLRLTGAVAIETYVSARTTNAPVTFRFSDFRVSTAGPELLAIAPLNQVALTPQPLVAAAAPTATFAPTPSLAPTPTVAQLWQALQPQLDSAWGIDTPRTILILSDFVARFPDYEAAREKLYAALLAAGRDQLAQGDSARAVDLLERARALFPTRAEALDALVSLTPTPVPPVQREPAVVLPAQPAPAPAARSSAPAPPQITVRPPAPPAPPVRAPVVQAAAPTPTKVPFVPPRSAP